MNDSRSNFFLGGMILISAAAVTDVVVIPVSRYLYTLNPANKKGSYVLEEDLIILDSVKEFGVGESCNVMILNPFTTVWLKY